MLKYLFIISCFFVSIFPVNIEAQELKYPGKDSLDYFLSNHQYISYFNKIRSLSADTISNKDATTVLELGQRLQQDFGVLTPDERKILRITARKVGYNLWTLTGNVDQSLTVYLVAHDNVENKLTLDTSAWFVENRIANLYTRKGDFEKAEYFLGLVITSLDYYHMPKRLSRSYTNLGTLLVSSLKQNEAVSIFKKGYNLADSIDYIEGKFSNALALAAIYNDRVNLDSAEFFLTRSREFLPEHPKDNNYFENKSVLEFEYGRLNFLKKNFQESIRLFQLSIQNLNQKYNSTKRREFTKIYMPLANAYLLSSETDSAYQTIQLGITSLIPDFDTAFDFPTHDQLYPENSFVDLFDLKARYYERLDSISSKNQYLEKALSSIQLALYVNDRIRETFVADPSKLVSIQSNKDLIDHGISILYRLSSRNDSTEYVEEARSFFNRSKSLLYNEKTFRNRIAESMSIEDKEHWRVLLNKNLELHKAKSEDNADINAINGEILLCQERIDSIFSNYENTPISTSKPDQYIEYFFGEKEIFGLSSLDEQNNFIQVGSRVEFQILMDRMNEYLLLKGLSMDEGVQNDMYRFLVSPFTNQLPGRLVIIPDGAIGFIPFDMLKDEKGNYVIENTTISYAFEYLTFLPSVRSEKQPEIYCLAPHYPVKESKTKEITRGSIYNLPFAQMEVDSIHNLFKEIAVTSQSGDKTEWEKNIDNSSIFHYAGHAIIRGDKSYLVFNVNDDESQQLTAKEISMMHYPLELVVLSACETGLGKLEQGEGIRSLGKSFMECGAQATVISLWNVNDRSTAIIMTDFYKNLKTGLRKDEALRQAKLDFLKETSPQYSNPYYWAAFIPAGDMRALNKIN